MYINDGWIIYENTISRVIMNIIVADLTRTRTGILDINSGAVIINITILNCGQIAVAFDAVIGILDITIREHTAGTAVEFYPILMGTAGRGKIKGDRRRRGANNWQCAVDY